MPDNFYDSQHSQGEGVVLAHTLMGQPVGTTTAAAAQATENADVSNASGWSTRPYKPPARRRYDGDGKAKLCSAENCRAFPMKSVPYCSGHARSLGLVDKKFQLIGEPTDEHLS